MTGILVVFLLAGHFIMIFFGISIPGIRIAGGLVIGFLGFKMLFPVEAKITKEEKQEAIKKSNISFSPLAMPSLAGPGAIATVITISSSIDGRHGYDKAFAFARCNSCNYYYCNYRLAGSSQCRFCKQNTWCKWS